VGLKTGARIMVRPRRVIGAAALAAVVVLVAPLPRPEHRPRRVFLTAHVSVATTSTTATTTTTPSTTTTAIVVRVAAASTRRGGAAPAPRAAAPISTAAGIAKAVWDIPGSGYQRGDPVVGLSFDDGPDARWTPQVLDILDRYGVKATFFTIGRMAAGNPDLVRNAIARGHGVGNHTWDHVDLRHTSDYAHQVDDTTHLLGDVTGRAIACLRPPFGNIDRSVTAKLGARGLTAVLWDVDTRDWSRPGTEAIVQRALSGARAGSIILFHDGGGDRSETVAALPRVIEGLQRAGLRPVAMCNGTPPPPPPIPETTTTTAPEPEPTTTTAPDTTTTSIPPETTTTTQ
jgi:peptidoglycan/xylan/chitin deacetylase (PgdA/CDA1 family)